MKRGVGFWKAHIAAINREGVATSVYAKRHALAVKSLYRWQHKLNDAANATAVANHGGAFVALRVAATEPVIRQVPTGCTLILGSGLRLEMATLPAPEWLAVLGRATQGER
jgi:hypothetical protein